MAYPRDSEYHADSDADDEFERSIMPSPTQAASDSDEGTLSGPPSARHAPNAFGQFTDMTNLPKTVISAWNPEECAQFLSNLKLHQYCESFLDNGIDGEALIALKHDELKEMGISSLGHRLTILKRVYDVKVSQDVVVEEDDFVPQTVENDPKHDTATKDDILKVARSLIKLRDERIAQVEAQLTQLNEEYRKLQQQLMPVFKMVKEHSAPLPNPNGNGYYAGDYTDNPASPPTTAHSVPETKTAGNLGRTISTRLPNLRSGKTSSPTHIPSTIPERSTGLNPSAAATQASKDLGNSMHHGSPATSTLPSPTSPNLHPHQAMNARTFSHSSVGLPRYEGPSDEPVRSTPTPSPATIPDPPHSAKKSTYTNSYSSQASTIVPREQSASVPPHVGRSDRPDRSSSHAPETEAPSVEIFKSFRVALEDPCYKVLPAALRKYNIPADWRQYALYIVYGDQERCVGLEEKPLALFKDLDREGKKPMFMLRKLANPVDLSHIPGANQGKVRPMGSSGGASGGPGVPNTVSRSMTPGIGMSTNLPGGVL